MRHDPSSTLGSSLTVLLTLSQLDDQLSDLASEGIVTTDLKAHLIQPLTA